MNTQQLVLGKYRYPGTGWFVLCNGHICFSGKKVECEKFILRNTP